MPEAIGTRRTIYFLFSSSIFSMIAGFLLYPGFREWESEAHAVIIARSASSVPASDMASNLVAFSGTDSYLVVFSERLAEKAPRGADDASRKYLSESLSVEKGEGSMIIVRFRSDDPKRAKALAREAALSLFVFAGQYYNVKTEADFRIVGSVPERMVVSDRISLTGISACFGVAITALLFLAVSGMRSFRFRGRSFSADPSLLDTAVFEPKRPFSVVPWSDLPLPVGQGESAVPDFSASEVGHPSPAETPHGFPNPQVTDPAREHETAIPDVSDGREGSVDDASPETPSSPAPSSERKAAAPSNLPGIFSEAEDRFLREFSFEPVSEEEGEDDLGPVSGTSEGVVPAEETSSPDGRVFPVADTEKPVEGYPEPTEEEYRRRLNELLRG